MEATLYLGEVYRDPKGRVDASFVWIPQDIESKCLERPLKECEEYDHCLTFPTSQKCSPDLSNCRPIINEPCERYGITIASAKNIKRTGIPPRVLSALPYEKHLDVERMLKRWKIPLDFTGTRRMETISKKHSVRARVKWELWTNGQNFSILSFLP